MTTVTFSQSCKGTTGGMTNMTLMLSPKTPQDIDCNNPTLAIPDACSNQVSSTVY